MLIYFYYYSSAYVYRVKHNNITDSTSGRLRSTHNVPYLIHIMDISSVTIAAIIIDD